MKFVILCYPRTASTLLISALGELDGVRQGMELFNPVLEGDAPWVHWRKSALNELFGPQQTYLNSHGYLDEQRFDLSLLMKKFFEDFDGTKIMYDQLSSNSPVWDYLASLRHLNVIVLRRNIIEAAVSFQIAMETNVWHVPNGDLISPTPRLNYEPGYFGWFHDHFCARENKVLDKFSNRINIYVKYEDLTTSWRDTFRSIQSSMGMHPKDVPMPYQKGTKGTIDELIVNYSAVKSFYDQHPVLSSHFATAK